MNRELPDVQAGFRKGRGTRDQIANIRWIMDLYEKAMGVKSAPETKTGKKRDGLATQYPQVDAAQTPVRNFSRNQNTSQDFFYTFYKKKTRDLKYKALHTYSHGNAAFL